MGELQQDRGRPLIERAADLLPEAKEEKIAALPAP
jgi:hypothetical protein